MSCSVKGTGCRVCPGMWLAGILLAVALLQGLFADRSTTESTPQVQSSAQSR
jgi:hypothetical protein